ncbi:MAG: CoA transferase [Spirochaetota bacterium]|nr:CoA transferase [Spirochaetota bacterium]
MAITRGPLTGIRVLDLTENHSGPFGSMLLGDLGAEIIKIESPLGDCSRQGEPSVSLDNHFFLALNRNKGSIILDIESKLGKRTFHDLVEVSDVIISNSEPALNRNRGLDFDTLERINPKIITCNISGYGESGPYAEYPPFDIIACGHSGLLSLSGEPGRAPLIPGGISLGEMMGGIFAVMHILSALMNRDKDGMGLKAEVNLFDSLLFMQKAIFQHYFSSGMAPTLQGGRHMMLATYGVFETKDGYLTLGPSDESKIIEVAGLGWMFEDPKLDSMFNRVINREEFNKHFEEALRSKTTEEWVRILRDENDLASGPVLNYGQVINDPQVQHNNMIWDMQLESGEKYKTIGSIFKMPNEIEGRPTPPSDLGRYTEEVLRDKLGYSDEQISEIRQENEAARKRLVNQ